MISYTPRQVSRPPNGSGLCAEQKNPWPLFIIEARFPERDGVSLTLLIRSQEVLVSNLGWDPY
jgi:hypothetical protein